MTRRNYLKGTVILLVFGVLSGGLFKWIKFQKPFSIADIVDTKDLIAEIAEIILPESDTPGAKRAGVASYIINILINCTSQFQQHSFMSGLINVDEYAHSNYGRKFVDCQLKEKEQIITYFETNTGFDHAILNKIREKLFGKPFFLSFKDLTIQGYCNSRIGATQGLAYDYIPTVYDSCITMQPNQKSWATK